MIQPLVTIGIPTVDRMAFLEEAVESALAQTWPRIEVLVGDDGDTKGIREWCVQRSARDARLIYHRNPRRLGLAGNWNAIAQRAAGEYIAFIGDDDRLLPHFVERLMTAATPATAVAFCNHFVIGADGIRQPDETERVTREYHRADLGEGAVSDPSSCAWQAAICASAYVARRADIVRLGFHEELNSPDVEFFIRLAGEGVRFDFCREYLVEFRVHAGSETSSGLRHDDLVARLLHVMVPAEVEPWKRALLERLIVNAASRALQLGDWRRARGFLASGYYPVGRRSASYAIQVLCATLRAPIGTSLYRAIHSVKRGRERRRASHAV